MPILIPVSIGELIDKITILEIKSSKFPKNECVLNELDLLSEIAQKVTNSLVLCEDSINELICDLKFMNYNLWEIEDRLREFEKEKLFNEEFIELARSVYYLNDKRSQLKKEINKRTKSDIQEFKSYSEYK